MKKTPLDLLLVEDSTDDADLILAELRRAGFDPGWKRVETEVDFLAEIKKSPTIILSDYSMPGFSGLRALELLRASGLNIPFILISGTVGEHFAVEAIKQGAADYLLKDRITRLGVAIEHALQQKILKDERRQVEVSLNLFRTLLDRSNDGIEVIDPETGRFLDVNQTTCQRSGYTRQELLSLKVHQIDAGGLTFLSWPKHVDEIHRKGFEIFESQRRRKEGPAFPVEINVCWVKLDRDYLIANVRDITERKKLEAEVAMREQRLNAFFTSAPAGLVLLDNQLRYVQINETVARVNGVAMQDHLGKTVREVLPKLAPVTEPLLQKVLATGEPILNIELSGETPSQPGVTRHWLESFFPINGKSGRPEGVGAIFVEISERKQAEQELQWKTALLEAQMESALDGILVVTNQGLLILQNQRMKDLWKFPPHIAESKEDAVQVEFAAKQLKNPAQFAAKITHLNAHPDEVSRDEIELVDGTVLDRYSSPVRDKAGTHFGRIWTFRDITEQRKLEEHFRQSQKMEALGKLAGGVAHDFNNLLAVIQLQVGLLKSEKSLSLEQIDLASGIENAARRAANLTRQLLLFSRQQHMQPRKLKLKDAVENIIKLLQRTLGEQIQLQFKSSAENLVIYADPGMIDQILLNLAVNARDAMPKGGQIVIETSAVEFDDVTAKQFDQGRPGSFVCLGITDTGCGIPPEILPRIFEPFFTTKEVGKGTGLGLATVFGIVQQHKGWISIDSEINRGTTFRVYLPRPTQTPDTTFLRSSLETERGGDETILLVEDELALRTTMRAALSRLGYRVLEASSGDNALELWQQHRDEIHLLLTDLVMPGGTTGKELAERLLKQNSKLKVIYTSGYSAEIGDKELTLEDGVNFLTKPFVLQKLAQTIRKLLDQN